VLVFMDCVCAIAKYVFLLAESSSIGLCEEHEL
jgi:hypothetical protein